MDFSWLGYFKETLLCTILLEEVSKQRITYSEMMGVNQEWIYKKYKLILVKNFPHANAKEKKKGNFSFFWDNSKAIWALLNLFLVHTTGVTKLEIC